MNIISKMTSSLKRTSRIGILGLTLASVLIGVGSVALAAVLPLKSSFKAYDATRFREDPNLSKYGLTDITVAYEDSLWPAGASKSEPNTTYIANNYIPKIRSKNPKLIVLDIEVWKFGSGMTSTQITANINKFKKIIAVFRRELPTAKLGIYLIMPERNWLAPCGDPGKVASRTAAWHQRNLQLAPLAQVVDVIVPSLYAFYSDAASVACWPKYAAANIKEARMYGKPVIPFLWMRYHSTGNLIPATFWRKQLDTAYALGDGLAIWSMASSTTRWSYSSTWWLETVKFLQAQKLVP